MTRYYTVAEHVFSVTAEDDAFKLMTNYEPFVCLGGETREQAFGLTVTTGETVDYSEETRQDEEGQEIVCGHTADGRPVFEFRWWGQDAGWLVCEQDYRQATLVSTGELLKMAIDNALMVLYALATANRQTVLFHAAVTSYKGKGYMFLGVSGTGKSTHASLWCRYIEGTELVNDDNPVVRIGDDGQAVVYGSPWSGKTPCYRQVHYPLGGIVLLSQAPYNKIHALHGIMAYASLVPSISGKRWETAIADGLHETENALAQQVPVWHLECLPDEAAARLCQTTIAG